MAMRTAIRQRRGAPVRQSEWDGLEAPPAPTQLHRSPRFSTDMTPVPLRPHPFAGMLPVIHRGLSFPPGRSDMQGFMRATARLVVMGLVMAAVLVGAAVAGIAATTAIAIGIVLAGVVGLVGIMRRPRKLTLAEEMAAMLAADPLRTPPPTASHPQPTAVEAMAPPVESPVDPESRMPRWRRPSLLEARHADYSHLAATSRLPMRFGDEAPEVDVRVVRYAVVPVLDRPDEVLGLRQSDLASGDEVQVLAASGTFLEVLCPNGDQGWVHRTTLGQRGSVGLSGAGRLVMRQEADDALTALLSARGLI
jgi:hypothetical protein